MARSITDVAADIEALIHDAYQRGLAEGVRRAKERILRAASLEDESGAPVQDYMTPVAADSGDKVPNGTIRPILRQVLTESPGLSTAEAGRRVIAIDPRVTPASVTNELNRNSPAGVRRRGRGEVLYVKVEHGWHLAQGMGREFLEQEQESDASDEKAMGPEASTSGPILKNGAAGHTA